MNTGTIKLVPRGNLKSAIKTRVTTLSFKHFLINTKHTYHPRTNIPHTDGQTERINLDIQAYLKAFVNEKQDDWPSHLKMAQYVLNNAVHSTIGMSPNMALMGNNIPFPDELTKTQGKDIRDTPTSARK